MATIERIALDPSVSIEKMSKLLELQERVLERQSRMAFTEAMARLQPRLPTVGRSGTITILNKEDREKKVANPRVEQTSKFMDYADLVDAIREPLGDEGFTLTFKSEPLPDGKIMITGTLRHREGHAESTSMALMLDTTGSKNNLQAAGSSMSYGMRYCARLLLNIASRADDRDKNATEAGGNDVITEEQLRDLEAQMRATNTTDAAILDWVFGKDRPQEQTLAEFPAAKFEEAKQMLARKAARNAKGPAK